MGMCARGVRQDSTTITTTAPGLYEVTFGFFTRKKPAVQLLVNGEPVVNVRQMYDLVERLHHEADHLHFELKCVGGNAAVVVETATAIAVRDDILETYRIPAHASKDLLEGGVA